MIGENQIDNIFKINVALQQTEYEGESLVERNSPSMYIY